jgi:hypothetical protein
MTLLTKKNDEVELGDLVKVDALMTDTCHFYLVIGIEIEDDPSLVSYKALHDGKIVMLRKMTRRIRDKNNFIVSKSNCND